MTILNCTTCYYSDESVNYGEPVLICRRRAPQIVHGTGTGFSTQKFPIVSEVDWCGEYAKEEHSNEPN